jgi:hypothetical protein
MINIAYSEGLEGSLAMTSSAVPKSLYKDLCEAHL